MTAKSPQVLRSVSGLPLPLPQNITPQEPHPTLIELSKMTYNSVAATRFRHTPKGKISDISTQSEVSGFFFMAENPLGNWSGYVGSIEGKPILSLTHLGSTNNGTPTGILLNYDEELNPQLEIYYPSYVLLYH